MEARTRLIVWRAGVLKNKYPFLNEYAIFRAFLAVFDRGGGYVGIFRKALIIWTTTQS